MVLLHVVVQMALRQERLLAGEHGTNVGSFSSVQSHVGFQISFLVEGFVASFERAHKVSPTLMLLQVDLEPLLSAERLVTARVGALKLALLGVDHHVVG